jgi:hypothetical protein
MNIKVSTTTCFKGKSDVPEQELLMFYKGFAIITLADLK